MPDRLSLELDDTLVFIGDSITDADRCHPAHAPLGNGYVHYVGHTLMARYPRLNLNIVNTGISGNTMPDLRRRWTTDSLSHRPNILTVLIGINDAWLTTMESGFTAKTLGPERYEITYDQLLLTAREQCNCQIVLLEPFVLSTETDNPLLSTARAYIQIVRKLAEKHGAVLVPLQERIDLEIQYVPAARWSQDTVHPYPWAHAWIAQRWLEATGL